MEQDTGFDLGIDIGSSAVRVVLTKPIRNYGESTTLEIVGLGKAPCKDGVIKGNIKNLDRTSKAIEQALDEALTKSGYSLDQMPNDLFANVNVSGKNIKTKTDYSTITRKTPGDGVKNQDICQLFNDVHRTVVPDGTKIVHVLPIDFTVDDDNHIHDPIGRIGNKLCGDFQIITGNVSDLEYIKQTLKTANYRLGKSEFVVSPLAAALSVLDERQKKMGVVLVDIGSGTTDVAIFHKGVTRHIAILPFAGNHITEDIEECCNLDNEGAESAKFAVSNSDPASCLDSMLLVVPTADGIPPVEILAKNVAKVIQARLREIAAMVLAEIKRAGYESKLGAGIVLTGGTSKIQNIDKTFAQITGIPTQIGKLKGIGKVNVNEQIVSDSSWATALGLAWLDVKKLDVRIPDSTDSSGNDSKDGDELASPSTPKSPVWPHKGGWKQGFRDVFSGIVNDKIDGYTNS
jgi:cell division protein FtsA